MSKVEKENNNEAYRTLVPEAPHGRFDDIHRPYQAEDVERLPPVAQPQPEPEL